MQGASGVMVKVSRQGRTPEFLHDSVAFRPGFTPLTHQEICTWCPGTARWEEHFLRKRADLSSDPGARVKSWRRACNPSTVGVDMEDAGLADRQPGPRSGETLTQGGGKVQSDTAGP